MSETVAAACHTEHALLVLLGQYAQHLGLIKALMAVPLHQQTRTFAPQTKWFIRQVYTTWGTKPTPLFRRG